jgi:hypothetical protein
MKESLDLVIPVYLNQRIVFDLISMLQDGISTVSRVTTVEEASSKNERKYGASFGLSQAFSSVLKINVGGKRELGQGSSDRSERSEERIHTPASLFQKLWKELGTRNGLTKITSGTKPDPGMIVEFVARMQKNSVVEAIEAVLGVAELAESFSVISPKSPELPIKKKEPRPQESDLAIFIRKLRNFYERATSGDFVDIIGNLTGSPYTAVISLEKEYLSDPKMSDLIDGEFTVVGKVVNVLSDSDKSINLLRRVALGAICRDILDKELAILRQVAERANVKVPEPDPEVRGPLIQVVPVGIFA